MHGCPMPRHSLSHLCADEDPPLQATSSLPTWLSVAGCKSLTLWPRLRLRGNLASGIDFSWRIYTASMAYHRRRTFPRRRPGPRLTAEANSSSRMQALWNRDTVHG